EGRVQRTLTGRKLRRRARVRGAHAPRPGSCGLLCRDEARDLVQRPEVVDLELLERYVDGEILFEGREQLDEREGVHDARGEQIDVRRRHVDLQVVGEELRDSRLELAGITHPAAPGARWRGGRTATGRRAGRRSSGSAAGARCSGSRAAPTPDGRAR